MKIGVATEIKPDEYRVSLTPAGARELSDRGHEVVVQSGAGAGARIGDADYEAQGARIAPDAARVFDECDLVLKVKEPQPQEVAMLRPGQMLFTYLHLAPAPELTAALIASGATCIAYETVEDRAGRLPLLAPMSEIAGRLAAQAAALALQRNTGGLGKLIGGAPGVEPAQVLVLGGGMVGVNAAIVAAGMGAQVTILDRDLQRLRELDLQFMGRIATAASSTLEIERRLPTADVVIGAVLVRGSRAPALVRREDLGTMRDGAVLVDVAIDQGGCFETSRPTTHADPIFTVDGIQHYCVANMPGAVPVTSTQALTNATLPYVVQLAELGLLGAVQADPGLAAGVSVVGGRLTSVPVARDQGIEYAPVLEQLAA